MKKEQLKPYDIIVWQSDNGLQPIGIYGGNTWFHAAINFVPGEPDRIWWADEMHTEPNGEVDFEKVRLATKDERKKLMLELGESALYEMKWKDDNTTTAWEIWNHVAERYKEVKPKLHHFLKESTQIVLDNARPIVIVRPANAEQQKYLHSHASDLNELFSALCEGTLNGGGEVVIAEPEANPLPF